MSRSLPINASIRQLKIQAKDLLKSHERGDVKACEILRLLHMFSDSATEEILQTPLSLNDAQFAIALSYGFKGWKHLLEKVASRQNSIDDAKSATAKLAKGDIIKLFLRVNDEAAILANAERATVYAKDAEKDELVTWITANAGPQEIRIPISSESIAGYSVNNEQPINITDAYDENELNSIGKDIAFNKSIDYQTGFQTRQVLTVPILFEEKTVGVIQLLNKKNGNRFTLEDQKHAEDLARHLGAAFNNRCVE